MNRKERSPRQLYIPTVRHHIRTFATTYVAMSLVLAISAVSAADPIASAVGSAQPSYPTCAPLPILKVVAVNLDGHEQPPLAGDGLGRRYYLSLHGEPIPATVPPPNFRPATASSRALSTFGFPPKPSDPPGLNRWLGDYAQWVSPPVQSTPSLCQGAGSSSLTVSATSPNWAGGMNVNGTEYTDTYTQSAMRWVEPVFDGACGTYHPGYTVWSGLGGWNSRKSLIQSGIDIVDQDYTTPYFFWEVLKPGFDNA